MRPTTIHLDLLCPWSWVTSRWLHEVATVGGLEVTWRLLSLRVLDEAAGDDVVDESHERGHDLLCLVAAAREQGGNEAAGRLMTALGETIWEGPKGDDRPWRRPLQESELEAALVAAGLERDLHREVTAAHDEVVRAETAAAVALVGPGLGSPVVAFEDGPAFFGPVISTAPRGDEAVQQWKALETLALQPGFHELKTSRGADPDLPVLARD